MYRWDFAPVLANADLLAAGLLNTLRVTGTALVVGVALGLALALLRLSRRRLASWPAGFVIEVFRTTPPLVQLFWFYFALPLVAGIEMTPFMAAATTFSIQSAAFFAEVFRAGIASVERGQWEAARALGLGARRMLQHVILPQVSRQIIPSLISQFINLLKNTSIGLAVGFADLMAVASTTINQAFKPVEVMAVVAVLYLSIGLLLATTLNLLNARLRRSAS